MFNSKVFLAEFIGTFALVFVGMSAGVVNADLVGIALAYGLTLAVFCVCLWTYFRHASQPGRDLWACAEWHSEMDAGCILLDRPVCRRDPGSVLFENAYRSRWVRIPAAMVPVGALTEPQPIFAMVVEAILTFFLVNTYLNTAVASKGGVFAGWAIGATLTFATLVALPVHWCVVQPCAHSCHRRFC